MACPLVTVLTPVYNGERYLAECIESVINQSYENFEYFIVNNCSTDNTLDIASRYARGENRIRVVSNNKFVNVIENHNISFSYVSRDSKYCKVVSADDWIRKDCIEKMVQVAETHPSIGIIGSYQLSGDAVKWKGLPPHVDFISGREVVRLCMLQNLSVFGNPTSELYRSDLIREYIPFFPHSLPYADITACYKYLQNWDFGFVHEVLSTERVHEHRVSSKIELIQMVNLACLEEFLKFGPVYLSPTEFETEKRNKIDDYHRWLGGCLLKMNGYEFWKYQRCRLKEFGYPMKWSKVINGVMAEIIEEIQDPVTAYQKLVFALKKFGGNKR